MSKCRNEHDLHYFNAGNSMGDVCSRGHMVVTSLQTSYKLIKAMSNVFLENKSKEV